MLENPMYLAEPDEPAPFLDCAACEEQRVHTAAEWRDFHPYAGHGFTAAQGWTHNDLREVTTMPYTVPAIGTILPAKKNETVENPGPVHDPHALTEWNQAQAQDKAYELNQVLIEDWKNAIANNPAGSQYAANLGNSLSWVVVVIEAEADNVTFDRQRIGPAVNTLATT